jgi:predicted Zn-dependent protease
MSRYGYILVQKVRQRPRRVVMLVALLIAAGFGGALASVPLRAYYHYQAARQAEQRHRLAPAQEHIDRCLALWPQRAAVYLLAARICRRRGAHDDAERHLDACERILGTRTEPVGLERILLQVQRGDVYLEEERYLASYVERDAPEAPLVLEGLARGYLELLRFSAALDCLNRCLQKQPDNIPALLLRGRTRERLSSIEALEDYRAVLALEPDQDEARLRLAESLFTFGQADEAAQNFEVLQQRRPNDPAVRLGLARCRHHAGKLDEARLLLDGLLADDARNLGALRERGRLELEAGHGAEAERCLRRAVAIDPSDRDANHLLTQALFQQGKTSEAQTQEEQYERVLADLTRLGQILNTELKARPRDAALCCELGTLYLRYGKRHEGVYWLLHALEYDSQYEPARKALADAHVRTGDEPSP